MLELGPEGILNSSQVGLLEYILSKYMTIFSIFFSSVFNGIIKVVF